MKKYTKSITTALICFALVIVLNFLLPRLLPGDPVAYLSGSDESSMSEEKYQYYYDALHLGESLPRQFVYYLESIFDGSLGYSYKLDSTVSTLIRQRLSYTLQISLPAVVLSCFIGLSWGLYAGQKSGHPLERISSAANVLINSLPVFVIGLILIISLCFKISVFPYTALNTPGLSPGSFEYFADRIIHMVLPVSTLVIAELPSRYLLIRNLAADEMGSKYILYARQRGLSDRTIRFKYILPNITGPFINMIGLSVASSVGGSLVVENLFSIKGMGTLLTDAVHSLDYPLMQGILFICTFIMVIAIVLSDIICILADPRLRKGEVK